MKKLICLITLVISHSLLSKEIDFQDVPIKVLNHHQLNVALSTWERCDQLDFPMFQSFDLGNKAQLFVINCIKTSRKIYSFLYTMDYKNSVRTVPHFLWDPTDKKVIQSNDGIVFDEFDSNKNILTTSDVEYAPDYYCGQKSKIRFLVDPQSFRLSYELLELRFQACDFTSDELPIVYKKR